MRCVPSKRAYYQFAKFKRGFKNTGSCSMRYAPLLSFALLGLSGCVAPVPTSTTYVTPATTTTYTRPATSTTVMNAPPGYQPGYMAPQPTTTVIRTP
jgi:hypothetical protein